MSPQPTLGLGTSPHIVRGAVPGRIEKGFEDNTISLMHRIVISQQPHPSGTGRRRRQPHTGARNQHWHCTEGTKKGFEDRGGKGTSLTKMEVNMSPLSCGAAQRVGVAGGAAPERDAQSRSRHIEAHGRYY
jgi:hypothetical protein